MILIADMSQPSLGGIEQHERDDGTPPVSPSLLYEGTSGIPAPKQKQSLFSQKTIPAFTRKYQDSSLEADDTESELVAIPESDLSESTLHNSSAPVTKQLKKNRYVVVNKLLNLILICRAHLMIQFTLKN